MKILLMLTSVLLFAACKLDQEKMNTLEKTTISAINHSNEALSQLSNKNYSSLSSKLRDATYGEIAPRWNNKAQKLKVLSNNAIDKLESITLLKEIPLDTISSLKTKYINDVLQLDSGINQVFKKNISAFFQKPDKDLSQKVILAKTKNDLLYFESIISQYLNENAGLIIEDYTVFSVLVGQNSTHFKSGEILELSAGVGSYTIAANPKFIFNRDTIRPGSDARGVYKFKVSGTGKQHLPLRIIYTNPQGLLESKDFSIEYNIEN